MNEGGKLLVAGKFALQGGWDQFLYNPLGPTPPKPPCKSNQTRATATPTTRGPELQLRGRRPTTSSSTGSGRTCRSRWRRQPGRVAADDRAAAARLDAVLAQRRRLGAQPGQPLLVPDDVEHPAGRASTRSSRASRRSSVDRPPAFDPPTGNYYMYSQQASSAYKRLSRTVDLTGKTTRVAVVQGLLRHRAELRLRVRRGAHRRPGRLDDAARHQRAHDQDTGGGCPDPSPFWLDENPFLRTTSPATRRTDARRRARRTGRRATGTPRPATRPASRTGTST